MQYRLTRQAEKAIEYARDIAEELQHDYVGTEHLMLGLIRSSEGLASQILRQNEVTEAQVLRLIEQLINDSDGVMGEVADYTPRARRVLECSSREALRLNQTRIGTEHLLIALLREKRLYRFEAFEYTGRQPSEDLFRITGCHGHGCGCGQRLYV